MQDFEFHNPTRIVFGRDAIDRAGELAGSFGEKILLVTGRGSVKRSGVYGRVRESLEKAGCQVFDLDGVQSNPLLSRVRDGIGIVQKNGVEAIFALGGGSVMDTAKAVAAGALLEQGDIWDVFLGKSEIKKALPVVTAPTIAASGSEMNGYMVITDSVTGYKLATGSPHVYPQVSILDPVLTFTVPRDYTAYGGVDAVCHLLETYFNGPDPHTRLQDRMAEGLVKTIMEATEEALKEPSSYEARATLMWGATLALCGLTKAGVGDHRFPVHLIEHAVSALYQVPHGAGLAAILPGWMEWFSKRRVEKLSRFGEKIFRVEGMTVEEKAKNGISAFKGWLRTIGVPASLRDLGLAAEDCSKIAKNCVFQAGIWGMTDEYSETTVKEILRYCI